MAIQKQKGLIVRKKVTHKEQSKKTFSWKELAEKTGTLHPDNLRQLTDPDVILAIAKELRYYQSRYYKARRMQQPDQNRLLGRAVALEKQLDSLITKYETEREKILWSLE